MYGCGWCGGVCVWGRVSGCGVCVGGCGMCGCLSARGCLCVCACARVCVGVSVAVSSLTQPSMYCQHCHFASNRPF